MGKVYLKSSLKSDYDNINIDIYGIKVGNRIIYKENDIKVVIILDRIVNIKRESCEYIINLVFDKNSDTKSTYTLLGSNKTFELMTKVNILNICHDMIHINYELEGNIFDYVLEWNNC